MANVSKARPPSYMYERMGGGKQKNNIAGLLYGHVGHGGTSIEKLEGTGKERSIAVCTHIRECQTVKITIYPSTFAKPRNEIK
jgi:hypothetical protein